MARFDANLKERLLFRKLSFSQKKKNECPSRWSSKIRSGFRFRNDFSRQRGMCTDYYAASLRLRQYLVIRPSQNHFYLAINKATPL